MLSERNLLQLLDYKPFALPDTYSLQRKAQKLTQALDSDASTLSKQKRILRSGYNQVNIKVDIPNGLQPLHT